MKKLTLFISTHGPINAIAIGSGGRTPLIFGTNDIERMRISPSGTITAPLPNYANDTAAGAAGLIAGDHYQIAGVQMIKQ